MIVYMIDGTQVSTGSPSRTVVEIEDCGVYVYPHGIEDGLWILVPWHRVHRIEGVSR